MPDSNPFEGQGDPLVMNRIAWKEYLEQSATLRQGYHGSGVYDRADGTTVVTKDLFEREIARLRAELDHTKRMLECFINDMVTRAEVVELVRAKEQFWVRNLRTGMREAGPFANRSGAYRYIPFGTTHLEVVTEHLPADRWSL